MIVAYRPRHLHRLCLIQFPDKSVQVSAICSHRINDQNMVTTVGRYPSGGIRV